MFSKFKKIFESSQKNNKTSLVFCGDIMQHQTQLDYERRRGYTYDGVFDEIKDLFVGADMVFGNLETVIQPEAGNTKNGTTPLFGAPEELLVALREAGFSHLGMANNHCNDHGLGGFNFTIERIVANKMQPMMGSNKIGCHEFFTFTTHINNETDELRFLSDINQGKDFSKSNNLIALPHWGGQFESEANENQKKESKLLHQMGFNTIIGTGPHVIQQYEMSNDKRVFYSLGNLLSCHQDEDKSNKGGILKLNYDGKKFESMSFWDIECVTENGKSRIVVK